MCATTRGEAALPAPALAELGPQATLHWQPLHQMTLRASYADGFRAPSSAEASNSESHNVVVDPLDPQHRPESWSARATLRYTAGYQNSLTNIGITTQKNVASFSAIDLNAAYRGLKSWKFDLSVVNVLNRSPPYDRAALLFFPSGPPFDPITYDDLGRMVDLHVTYSL